MFQMMLAGPVLAVFGAMGAAVVVLLGLLLGLGFAYVVKRLTDDVALASGASMTGLYRRSFCAAK